MPPFPGGMHFAQGRPIKLPPIPETLPAQPVRLCLPERPEVIAGQVVRQCQVLLEPQRPGRACHVSPVTGTVRNVAPLGDPAQGPCAYEVLIEPSMAAVPTSLPVAAPSDRKLERWLGVMRQVGPWGDRDGHVGILPQLAAALETPPDTVICVGLDSFPPYPVRSSLLVSFPDDVAVGTMVLANLVGAKRSIVLVGKNASVPARIRAMCNSCKVDLESVTNIYPSADPTLVAWSHAPGKRRLPHGHNPVLAGLLLISPWTAIRVARWATLGRLDLIRPVMIAWPESATAMTPCYGLAGQPLASLDPKLAEVLSDPKAKVILGNPLTGRPGEQSLAGGAGVANPSAWVVPEDELLVTVLPRIHPHESEPCISCGWCSEVCPTALRPVHLMELAQRGRSDARLLDHLPWCVDCGLCSYVCPVSLPLAQTLRAAAAQLQV